MREARVMAELFSSAWNYLRGGSEGGGEGAEGGGGAGSRFVGQEVDLGNGKVVKIKRIIAEGERLEGKDGSEGGDERGKRESEAEEFIPHCSKYIYCVYTSILYDALDLSVHLFSAGGFGYVFVARDTQTGKDYALKVNLNN